jgi:hypothetical protein
MSKIYVMGFILLTGLFVWWGTACSSNATIFLDIANSTGCPVTATLDGGSPQVNSPSSSGGPYTLWSNVSHGNHRIGIATSSKTSDCNYDINGGSQTVSVNYPCSTAQFTLACD